MRLYNRFKKSFFVRIIGFLLSFSMLLLWSNCAGEPTPQSEGTKGTETRAETVLKQDASEPNQQPTEPRETPDRSPPQEASQSKDTSTKPDDPKKPTGLTYHKDIRPILVSRCNSCHVKGGIGAFALTSYKEVYNTRLAIKSAVVSKTMPPWPADNQCRPYKNSMALSEKQIKTIKDWVESGAAEGDPKEYKEPQEKEVIGIDRVDLSLKITVPYTPQVRPDDYRCFVMPWPKKEKSYVTGFQIKAGNKALVHHVIAYLAPAKSKALYLKKEKDEKGPGYTCFGGPGGSKAAWLAAWAPGKPGGLYPKDTGILVEPGSIIILQIHYNTLTSNPTPDQTAIEFKIEKQVKKRGYIVPIASSKWKIPAGDKHYVHRNIMKNPAPFPLQIHSTSMHMHLLGKSARFFIQKADGTEACLINIPKWDFDWQYFYDFKTPFVINPKDKIGIECVWDNSAENQPLVNGKKLKSRDVTWGDGSTDEMCLGVVYATPL